MERKREGSVTGDGHTLILALDPALVWDGRFGEDLVGSGREIGEGVGAGLHGLASHVRYQGHGNGGRGDRVRRKRDRVNGQREEVALKRADIDQVELLIEIYVDGIGL